MKSVAIILENGFEEIEVITPYDLLNRAGIKCDLVSTKSNEVTGAHGLKVQTKLVSFFDDYEMIVLPGGMNGAVNLSENQIVLNTIEEFNNENKFVAAICASPAVVLTKTSVIDGKLTKTSVIDGKNVTCYPGMENNFKNSNYFDKKVVIDGNVITSEGPATSIDFSLALIDILGGDSKTVSSGILYENI